MKKTLISIAAVSTLAAAAVPAIASAQPYGGGYGGGWQNVDQRLANLDRRIDRGVQTGALTRREAQSLRFEFRQLVRLEDRYRHNGLDRWERADLNRRFDALSARIRWERQDGQDRRYDYGYGYGYGYRN